jgi:uncharacterized coiled-coil protein SlyX
MDELLRMWKQDKINSIDKRLQELEIQIVSTQNMIDHYNNQLNQANAEKTELESLLQKLLSF